MKILQHWYWRSLQREENKMLKSNMILKVSFVAETKIEDAIREAREKAIKYDLAFVHFKLNGSFFNIGKKANVKKALKLHSTGRILIEV